MPGQDDKRSTGILAPILLGAVLVFLFFSRLRAYDLWWHLTAGDYILDRLAVPRVDIFSYTAAGRPWIYHSWLGGVLLQLVNLVWGLVGLVFFRSVVMSASLLIMWNAARKRGVGAGLAALLSLAVAFQLQPRALTRPYMFSFLLFGLFFYELQVVFSAHGREAMGAGENVGKNRYLFGEDGRLIILPVLMFLWANLHGGFPVGLLLVGSFGAAEMVRVRAGTKRHYWRALLFGNPGGRFQAYLVSGVFCLAATMLNPHGAAVLTYPVRLFQEVESLHRIHEWQPTELSVEFGTFWVLIGMSVFCLLSTFARAVKTGRGSKHMGQIMLDLLLVGGFGLMAIRSVRNVAWFLLVVPPVLGFHLGFGRRLAKLQAGKARSIFYGTVAVVVAFGLAGWHASGAICGWSIMQDRLPVRACRYLKTTTVPGRVYNVYEWGGYLIWQQWPRRRVFIDGRCLVYGDEIIGEAMDVAHGKEGWRGILSRYGVQTILIRHGARDSQHFFAEGEWECVYWDDTALIAVRAGTSPELRRYELTNPVTFDSELERSEPERILDELDIVLDANPESWMAWTLRSRALLALAVESRKGDRSLTWKARDAARRSVKLSDGAPKALRSLARVLAETGEEKRSDKLLQRAGAVESE